MSNFSVNRHDEGLLPQAPSGFQIKPPSLPSTGGSRPGMQGRKLLVVTSHNSDGECLHQEAALAAGKYKNAISNVLSDRKIEQVAMLDASITSG